MLDELVTSQPTEIAALASANIRAARAALGITQASVARRMQQLGYGWYPQTCGLVERGQRPLLYGELAALALALQTTVPVLALPRSDVTMVRFGDQVVPAQRLVSIADDSVTWDGDDIRLRPPTVHYGPLDQRLAALQPQDPQYAAQVLDYAAELRQQGSEQPVVAAIVTSSRGVLITRRQDGEPPWGFVTGEIEPGELPEDAAVREVKEETTLEVRVGERIGERVHPVSGRTMIYLAARPAGRSTKVAVGDERELAEVRWASLAEADELLPGMFAPVREHLAAELGRRRPPRN